MASNMTSRAGFVALIGEPNAGKSTLLNVMVGTKISIVTHKVQTTRARIRGIAIEGASQIIFVDTPGLFLPRRDLDRAMVAAAWNEAADSDLVLLMVEAHRGVTDGVVRILDEISARIGGVRLALAINKVDRVKAGALLELAGDLNERFDFVRTFMISATKGSGVAGLRKWLAEQLPAGPWLYPKEQVADIPMRTLAAETTREQLTLRLHQELPYQMTVETERWEERKDGSVRIDQVVYVTRDGHRGIVVGKDGRTAKAVGKATRRALEDMLGRRVHLFIRVKVRAGWMTEAERFAAIGLERCDSRRVQ